MSIAYGELIDIVNSCETSRIEEHPPEELASAFSEKLPELIEASPVGVGYEQVFDFWAVALGTKAADAFSDVFFEKDERCNHRRINTLRPEKGAQEAWYEGLSRCSNAAHGNFLARKRRAEAEGDPSADASLDVFQEPAERIDMVEVSIVADIGAERAASEQPECGSAREGVFYLVSEKDLLGLWKGFSAEDELIISDDGDAVLVSNDNAKRTLSRVKIPA